jgi:two-component system chemotaxis response regulator CheY
VLKFRDPVPKSGLLGANPGNLTGAPTARRIASLMKPNKVLVVDDSKLLHRMFEMMLRQYPIVHAYDGREALERLAEAEHRDVDLILLDMNMPRMNGLEFLAAVKGKPETAHIPVVIVTTEGKEADTERGLKAGASAYVKKPFRNEELSTVIASLTLGAKP